MAMVQATSYNGANIASYFVETIACKDLSSLEGSIYGTLFPNFLKTSPYHKFRYFYKRQN